MKKKNEKATISDVATLAEVSKTTVSRFINGNFHMMSEATRRKIQDVIDTLDYRPSRVAQTLKSKHTRMIGCVIADITSPFSTTLVKGISDVCEQHDYRVLFINTNNDSNTERLAMLSLLDNRVDGLIVNTAGDNDDFIFNINRKSVPVVMSDRYLETSNYIDTISSTNYQGSYECVKHLSEAGYQRVYFFQQSVGGNKNRHIRYQAFRDASKEFFNNSSDYSFTIPNTDSVNTLKTVLKNLKEECTDMKTALFAVNGMMTRDILIAMKQLDFEIGVDFGVCGFDNWFWADLIGPGITAIEQDSYLTGFYSAQRLIDRIESDLKEPVILLELPTKLIIRGSTTIK